MTPADIEREEWAAGILAKCDAALAREREREIIAAWQAEQDAARKQRMARR